MKLAINLAVTALIGHMSLGFIAQAAEFDHSHQLLDNLLKHFVKDSRVNYAALQAEPKELDAYLDQLAKVSENDFQSWDRPQRLAWLINLYNAATLRLIINHYPIASIKKIGGLFKGPWDQPCVRLFGQTVTLGHIEHDILRRQYQEPRIHFALVCAALGCPPLRNESYTAEKLDQQLYDQGRTFMGTKSKNSVVFKSRTVLLSPIFKWFAEDFESTSGSVLKFVQSYFPEEVRTEMAKGSLKIRYTDYDWSLNDAAGGASH